MSKINSRAKGARGEREFAKWLRDRGVEAERGQQRSGSKDSPDVKCPALAGWHLEIKRVEALNIWNAMAQAERDADGGKPVVIYRRNGSEWWCAVRASDWLELVK